MKKKIYVVTVHFGDVDASIDKIYSIEQNAIDYVKEQNSRQSVFLRYDYMPYEIEDL